jgi:hypothetical protein
MGPGGCLLALRAEVAGNIVLRVVNEPDREVVVGLCAERFPNLRPVPVDLPGPRMDIQNALHS